MYIHLISSSFVYLSVRTISHIKLFNKYGFCYIPKVLRVCQVFVVVNYLSVLKMHLTMLIPIPISYTVEKLTYFVKMPRFSVLYTHKDIKTGSIFTKKPANTIIHIQCVSGNNHFLAVAK